MFTLIHMNEDSKYLFLRSDRVFATKLVATFFCFHSFCLPHFYILQLWIKKDGPVCHNKMRGDFQSALVHFLATSRMD